MEDQIPHAAVDVDEVAWAFPYPSLAERCRHLAAWWAAHREAGRDLVLVAEVVESPAHLGDLLAALGPDDHLLVRLDASPDTLRGRITAREPPGWHGLAYLLEEVDRPPGA